MECNWNPLMLCNTKYQFSTVDWGEEKKFPFGNVTTLWLLLNDLGSKFSFKCCTNIWWLFGLFWKMSFLSKIALATFWGKFRKLGNFFIQTFGHTASQSFKPLGYHQAYGHFNCLSSFIQIQNRSFRIRQQPVPQLPIRSRTSFLLLQTGELVLTLVLRCVSPYVSPKVCWS